VFCWRIHTATGAAVAGALCECSKQLWSNREHQEHEKTEVLFQPTPGLPYTSPVVTRAGETGTAAGRFCSLGSIIAYLAIILQVDARLAKANAAFGRLTKRPRNEHGVRL